MSRSVDPAAASGSEERREAPCQRRRRPPVGSNLAWAVHAGRKQLSRRGVLSTRSPEECRRILYVESKDAALRRDHGVHGSGQFLSTVPATESAPA